MQPSHTFRDTVSLGGWLFADLLLAIAVLFFAANTRGDPSPLPRITGFDPVRGKVGTQVVISGENFNHVERVKFSTSDSTFTSTSPTTIVAVVPSDAQTGPISVVTQAGIATSPSDFLVLVEPTTTPTPTPAPLPIIPTTTPTHTPSPTPSPTPGLSPTPCTRTVLLEKHEVSVDAGPSGGPPSDDALRQAFSPFLGRRAGLLLTFGRGPSPESGKALALMINRRLGELLPEMFDADSIKEGYHYLGAPYNSASFDVYLFSRDCH